MMGMRLEKLEKDLNLLTAMQNLLLSDCQTNTNNNSAENGQNAMKNQLKNNNKNTFSDKDSKNKNFKQNNSKSKTVNKNSLVENPVKNPTTSENNLDAYGQDYEVDENEGICEQAAVFEKVERIEGELRFEKEKRTDLEEAAQRVAIKLQKTEDDLQRETTIKKALLIETLELKNHIQSYIERVHKLEFEVKNFKAEQCSTRQNLESLNTEKLRLQEEWSGLNIELGKNLAIVKSENEELKKNLQDSECKLNTVQKCTLIEGQTNNDQNKKLQAQMAQLTNKYAHLEKERKKLMTQLLISSEKSQTTESNLFKVQSELQQLQISSQHQTLKNESLLRKSSQNLAQHKTAVSVQITQCHKLLSKTKIMISTLQAEKHELELLLEQCKKENVHLTTQLQISNSKLQNLESNQQSNQAQINSVISQNMSRVLELQTENATLKCALKRLQDERQNLLQLTNLAKIKFLQERQKFSDIAGLDKVEKERLSSEVGRIQDNFNVLQKINQDHGSTIQKLKSDAEENRKIRQGLEQDLHESLKNEQKLQSRLQNEESSCLDMEDELEFLHNQVKVLESQIEQHNCEDYVESVYKLKLSKLESTVNVQNSDWKASINALRLERDEAIAAGRKSKELAAQMKLECEKAIGKILSSTKKEVNELQESRQHEVFQCTKKISELEKELELLRSQSSQTQQSLSTRIQQLQHVLTTTTICLGGGRVSTSASSLNNNHMGTFNNNAINENILDDNIGFGFSSKSRNTNPFLYYPN